MRKSARLAEKPANKAQREPRAKKKRSDNRISNFATLDNGTTVEVFKFLNYCQLAKNSLVSKRFRNLIGGHRHNLALLYVDSLLLKIPKQITSRTNTIRVLNKKLSSEAYNEWVICNGYSTQVPLQGEVVQKQSAQYRRKVYLLWATAFYKDPISCQSTGSTSVFYAQTKLNNKQWPLFQHFVRLLMDPYIYIRNMELIKQNDVFNLLAGAIDPDRSRLQCKTLQLNHDGNVPKFISWVKHHMYCNEFRITETTNYDEELLDLLVTGAQCTSEINVFDYDISNVIFDYLRKFMDLKSKDESQLVGSSEGIIKDYKVIKTLKRDYGGFIVREEIHSDGYNDDITERVFEFVNNDVRKKLQITVKFLGTDDESDHLFMTIKICNG